MVSPEQKWLDFGAGANSPYYQAKPYDSCPLKKYDQNRGPNGTGPQIQNFDWGNCHEQSNFAAIEQSNFAGLRQS
jgi:hypothetical protein